MRQSPTWATIARPAMLATALVAACATQNRPPDRTLVLRVAPQGTPSDFARSLGGDADFAFAAQGYGPRGDGLPAILVRDASGWLILDRAPTAGGRFGRSPKPETARLAVGWDYRDLASRASVELPLMTSGSVNLPDSVVVTESGHVLRFNGELGIDESLTEIVLARHALVVEAARTRATRPPPPPHRDR